MSGRGEKCPLNVSGLKILTRAGDSKDLAVFVTRVIKKELGGKIEDKGQLNSYCQTLKAGQGLNKSWDDLLSELSTSSWVSGAKAREAEKKKENNSQPAKASPRGFGQSISSDRLAAIQQKLKQGDLSGSVEAEPESPAPCAVGGKFKVCGLTSAKGKKLNGKAGKILSHLPNGRWKVSVGGKEMSMAEKNMKTEPVKAKKSTPKKSPDSAEFNSLMHEFIHAWTKDLGTKVSKQEVRNYPRLAYLPDGGEVSDATLKEFKDDVAGLKAAITDLKRIAGNRARKPKPKPKKDSPEFNKLMHKFIATWKDALGGTASKLEVARYPRLGYLTSGGEISDLTWKEFKNDATGLLSATADLHKIADARQKKEAAKAKKAEAEFTSLMNKFLLTWRVKLGAKASGEELAGFPALSYLAAGGEVSDATFKKFAGDAPGMEAALEGLQRIAANRAKPKEKESEKPQQDTTDLDRRMATLGPTNVKSMVKDAIVGTMKKPVESGEPKGDGSGKMLGALGPAWTRDELEKPAGSKKFGAFTRQVYTAEQQKRLGVDENGNKRSEEPKKFISIGPAWTRGEMEAPKGTRQLGSFTRRVYTEEQQARLGVDENGKKVQAEAGASSGPKEAEPVTIVITRNLELLGKECAASGLAYSKETLAKIGGSRHTVSKFRGGKACIAVDGAELWIPDKGGVLVKMKPRKAPEQEVGMPKTAELPMKGDPSRGAARAGSPEIDSLREKIRNLERQLAIEEKRKELYRNELVLVKKRQQQPKQSKDASKNVINLISVETFTSLVKTYPGKDHRVQLIPSKGAQEIFTVTILVYLDSAEFPTLKFDTSHLDMETAKSLACTIAYEKLKTLLPYRRHFR